MVPALGQYFPIARGHSPTAAGLPTLPMIIGSTASSIASGQLITRYGRWKGFLVADSVLMVVGFGLLATTVTFFRSLGGTAGVSVLGAVLATHVADLIAAVLSVVSVVTTALIREVPLRTGVHDDRPVEAASAR